MTNLRLSLILLASILCVPGMSFAAPSFKTADRQHFEEVAAQALVSGKKVMWIASAAWCGPCATLEEFLQKDGYRLSPELDSYIIMHTEQTQTEFSSFTDLSPFEFYYYPTVRLFDPVTSKWSPIASAFDEVKWTKKLLAAFVADSALHPTTLAAYEAALKNGDSFDYTSADGKYVLLDTALKTASIELSLADAGAFYKRIRSDAATYPKQFQFEARYDLDAILNDAQLELLSRGFDLTDLRAIDPDALTKVAAGSSIEGSLDFSLPIRKLWFAGDYTNAALECAARAPKRATPPLQFTGGILCKEIEVLAGTMDGAAVEAYINAMPADKQVSAASLLVSLSLLSGRYDLAKIHQVNYFNNLIKQYGKSKTLKARIEASNQARVDAINQNKIHP